MGENDGCELVVETDDNGSLIFDLSTTIDASGMNKFHVNIATEDEPYEAKIYCQNVLRATRALDRPNNDDDNGPPLTYTVTGVPFDDDDDDDDDTTSAPTESSTTKATLSPSGSPTTAEP